MIANSESVFSTFTGFGRTSWSAALVPGIGTTLGSSSVQLASSLLISGREFSLALATIARSSEPSPLKSPIANEGTCVSSNEAVLSNTRASAAMTSSALAGRGFSLDSTGVAVACAIARGEGRGLLLVIAWGSTSGLLATSGDLLQALEQNKKMDITKIVASGKSDRSSLLFGKWSGISLCEKFS